MDSDYDVLVLVDSEVPFVHRQGLAMLALGRHGFSVDLLVYTHAEAERETSVLGSAVYWAVQEGVEFVA